MAQKTITQLPSAGFPGGADLVEIVQNGGSYKLSLQAIKNFVLQSSSSSSVSSSSSSLSSSSQSSSSSDSQSSSSQSGPGWLTVCDDADWMVSGGEGAWSPSAFGWKSTTGVAPYFLQLVPKNGWEVGFRPSTLRVGYVPSGGVNMELAVSSDVSPSGIALDLNYISDSEIPLTFASPSAASDDIAVVRFKSDTVFTVPCSATIEFYLGSSSSSSYSSSSSESSSSSSSSSSLSSSSSSSSSSLSSSSSSSSESSSSSSSSSSESSSSSSSSSSESSSSSSSSSSESSSSSSSSTSESSSSSSSSTSESSSSSSSSTSESSSSSSISVSSSSTSSSSESTFPLELEQLDVDDTNFPSYQGVKADQNFDIRPFAYTGGEYSQGIRTYSVNPSSGILDLVDETPITDGYLRAIYTESPGPSALVYAAGNELYTCSVNTTGGGVLLDSVDSGNNFYDITGEGDGTYLYAACFLYGLVTFGLSGVGIPYEIDRERTGGGSSFRTYGIITGAGFVFTCGRNNLPYGVRSFSVSAGIMTHIDTVETSFNFNGVHYAFGYLFSVGNQGLKSYSVNVSGGLTNIDTDHDGDSDEWMNVWSDERWLYVACGNDRSIRRYSVNVSGGLAMEQYINPGEFNSFKDVHASEGIVYVACAGGGLRTYSMLPQSSSSSSTSSSSESSSSYSSSSSSSSTSFSSSSLSESSSSSTSVSYSSSSFSIYDYMGTGWPLGRARMQVVIGSQWTGDAPFEEDDVVTLIAGSTGGASNYIYYSEDGTQTGNDTTNRLEIRIGQFTDQRFSIRVPTTSYSNFQKAVLKTDMGVGSKYDFKEFWDAYTSFSDYNSSFITPYGGGYDIYYRDEVFKSITFLTP